MPELSFSSSSPSLNESLITSLVLLNNAGQSRTPFERCGGLPERIFPKGALILTGWLMQRSRAFQPAKALGRTLAAKLSAMRMPDERRSQFAC
jgi:hypothetical protein